MKNIKLLLGLLLILLFACAKEMDDKTEMDGKNNQKSHVVSPTDALKDLESVLDAIDVKTRTGRNCRVVKSIEIISKDMNAQTRAGHNTDTLLYIVNFQDHKGYAILGADDRLDGVIALIDKGNLSADEFISSDCDDIDQPGAVYRQIHGYALNAIAENSSAAPKSSYFDPWQLQIICEPMLTTEWHQRDPYNFYCPEKNGQKCVAGCAAIATAQIVAYNKFTYGKGPDEISGYKLDWNGIFADMKNPGTNSLASALLIRAVGKAVNMEYGVTASSSMLSWVITGLSGLGYYNLMGKVYRDTYAEDMIRQRKLPTYIRGDGIKVNGAAFGGHAWVGDGYYCLHRFIWSGSPTDFSTPHEIIGEEYKRMVHCNFGWENALCNGYYVSEVFDLSDGSEFPDYARERYPVKSWTDLQIMMYKL